MKAKRKASIKEKRAPEAVPVPASLLELALRTLAPLGRAGVFLVILLVAAALLWKLLPESYQERILEVALGPASWQAVGYYPGVEIDEATHVVDMSEWMPGAGGKCCKVTWFTRMNVRRVREDARFLGKRESTTGDRPVFTSSTHEIEYRRVRDDRAGGPTMAKYDVLLDIAAEPAGETFIADLKSVRWNSFKDPQHEWATLAIMQPTRRAVLTLKFPHGKRADGFKFSVSPRLSGRNYNPLGQPPTFTVSPDGALTWVIEYPYLGNAYRVDWDW